MILAIALLLASPALLALPPVVLSLGPDGVRGTADDIAPDPAIFSKPFRDTTWTNDWVPFHRRGYYIVPSKAKREK